MRVNRLATLTGSFALAALAGLALTVSGFADTFHSAQLGAVLSVLLFLHLAMFPRALLAREFALYGTFVAYMSIQLLWTDDLRLAMNTLVPAGAFLVTLILYGSLVTYHNLRAVFAGTLAGFGTGAALYTALSGFPFGYPADFSYNAIAAMYLFGLFITLMLACHTRPTALLIAIAGALVLLILATTSIKTSLGILLGVMIAGVIHIRYFMRGLRRNAILLLILAGALVVVIASNQAIIDVLQRGVTRVQLGIEILQARENLPGYSAYESRAQWEEMGLQGWISNPVFGEGVEAFRARFGTTSHSTPIDVLYNSGLIGFTLFYAMFLSLMQRLLRTAGMGISAAKVLLSGSLACYLFISLSATVHYNALLAVFIAVGAALLRQHRSGI